MLTFLRMFVMFANVFMDVCDVCLRFHEGLLCLLTFLRRFVMFSSVFTEVCDVGIFADFCGIC